jgi:hypothetical protein
MIWTTMSGSGSALSSPAALPARMRSVSSVRNAHISRNGRRTATTHAASLDPGVVQGAPGEPYPGMSEVVDETRRLRRLRLGPSYSMEQSLRIE